MQDDNQNKQAVPSDMSDHDERDEQLARDLDWDQNAKDSMTEAAEHLKELEDDGTALSDEDWDKEEEQDDKVTDHLEAAIDASLSDIDMEEYDGLDPDEENDHPNNS